MKIKSLLNNLVGVAIVISVAPIVIEGAIILSKVPMLGFTSLVKRIKEVQQN